MSDNKDTTAEGELIEGHTYDGIQELNNRLPNWWLATFYGAIAFGVVYFGYYVLGPGPTVSQELERDQHAAELAAAANAPKDQGPDEKSLLALMADPAARKKGEGVFQTRCVSCHGTKGEGGIGPNLTDDYWIHGGAPAQIVKTITQGVGDKGMPPWGPVLAKEEIYSVAAFIKSLRGTKPPNAKAPQGELLKD